MDATIKVKVSELNTALLDRIKALFKGNDDAELTITFREGENDYLQVLERSRRDLEQQRNLISFTMEELEEYNASHKKK